MKVALVHDQLQEFGGAERVLIALKKIFSEADVFTSFYNPAALGVHAQKFRGWNITTSWADKIPLLNKLYSPLRFITPLIWETFSFKEYDLVISSSGSYMSKGIITRPETAHICYLHHPPRSLYDYETAIEWQKYLPVKIYGHIINHSLRMWDYLSSQRVDYFIANSEETKQRIQKFYRRDAHVLYPPVSISEIYKESDISLSQRKYYVTVSRLARAKHIEILIEAANQLGFQLKVVGTGRNEAYLKSLAEKSVEFASAVTDSELSSIFKNAKAFLSAAVDEEFGIAPIEAMGYGVPVIAYKSGGLQETVQETHNGFFFEALTADSLLAKIKLFEQLSEASHQEMKRNARATAERFSEEAFKKNMLDFIHTYAL